MFISVHGLTYFGWKYKYFVIIEDLLFLFNKVDFPLFSKYQNKQQNEGTSLNVTEILLKNDISYSVINTITFATDM